MAANKTQILVSARDRASATFGRVARNSTKAQKKIFGVNNALKSTDKTMGSLGRNLRGLAGGAAAGLGVYSILGSVKDAVAIKIEYDKINNVLKAVTGSSKAAGKEMKFLTEESERLGIQLRPLAQSYTRLSAAGRLLGLETKDTREIFTSFSEALTGFGATREQSIRVFTAIEQILSKGKVSAEELRQQLGEALPGSFQLAAKAAGVTVQELDGMLKRGELLSKDFILPYARAVRDEFGGAAVEGAKLLNAEFSKTINTLDKVKLAFIEGGDAGSSLSDGLARVLKSFREFLSDEDRLKRIAEAGVAFGAAMETAATAISKIANFLSKIPTEVVIGLGALALGGKGGRGAAASALTALSPTLPSKKQGIGAFAATQGQRNFLKPITSGAAKGPSGYVQGLLAGRSGFRDAAAVDARNKTNYVLGAVRPSRQDVFNTRDASLDSQTQIGPALKQLAGQDKVSKGFQNSFIVVEKVNKTMKEKLAPTLNVVSKGASKIGGAFKSLGTSILGILSPVNLLIGGLAIMGAKFFELRSLNEANAREAVKLEKQTIIDKAAVIAGQRRRAGKKVGPADLLVKDAITQLTKSGIIGFVSKELEKSLVPSVEKIVAKGEKVKEVIKKILDPTKLVVQDFEKDTKELLELTRNTTRLGEARAKELAFIKKTKAELEGKDIAKEDAKNLVEDRVAAQKGLDLAKAKEASDKTLKGLREKLKLEERIAGLSDKAQAFQRRVFEIMQGLLKSGLDEGAAKKRAEEQAKLEEKVAEKRKKKEPKGGLSRTDGAIGEVTRARSLQAGLKRQQRQEEQRAKKLENETFRQGKHLQDISEAINNFNVSFN